MLITRKYHSDTINDYFTETSNIVLVGNKMIGS